MGPFVVPQPPPLLSSDHTHAIDRGDLAAPGGNTPIATAAMPSEATQTSTVMAVGSQFFDHGIDPLGMLCDRLRVRRYGGRIIHMKGIDHVHIYAAVDKVCVFYYKDGKPNVIEEDANLFPSDGLVAQFRLIMG